MLPIAKQALGVFKTQTPEGVRVPAPDGAEYALYSFAPNLHVINGFVQAIVGLYDLGRISGDPEAQALYAEGERVARRELPTFDTGAWSLYSRGDVERESDLSYHQLLRSFLRSMCTRTDDPAYCDTELRFAQYELEPPVVSLVDRRGCAAARPATCACGCRRSRASGCASRAPGRSSPRAPRSSSATARAR